MARHYFIALDTHCQFTEMAIISESGKLLSRDRCATAIPAIVKLLEQVRRPRSLTFEEGPLADWLSRNLRSFVEQLIVCEPRRNALIAKEGIKDDAIDAERLAQLLRGGYLKQVHQSDSLDRSILKQHVSFYHDRIRERVRQGHQLTSLLRRHGVFTSISQLLDHEQRAQIWKELPRRKVLRTDLDHVYRIYEFFLEQEQELRAELIRLARREEPVRRFQALPGFGWVRALTFFVYIDTPHRFSTKSRLWRYCGLGLEHRHSGMGATKVRLGKTGNRRLKDILLGAAKSAILQGDNPFADKYAYWTQKEGVHSSTARRNVARCMANTLSSLWISGSKYDPALVRGVGRPSQETCS